MQSGLKWFAQTLWDLMKPPVKPADRATVHGEAVGRAVGAPSGISTSRQDGRNRPSMQDRYDALVRDMKQAYGVRVRRWRTSTSGCAWEVHASNGRTQRLIESPYPRGPMSCAVFLHEIGHHAIGFKRYRPRCLEEYHAWKWSIDMMEARGFNVTDSVRRRMHDSLRYALGKAHRRGLRSIPGELQAFANPPQPVGSSNAR